MRSGSFNHLQALCAGKGIVCERNRSKTRIELTTPDGGTTAECESIAEAWDTYKGDPAFANLPIKMNRRHEDARGLQASDEMIASALNTLNRTERGQNALRQWRRLVDSAACGFDKDHWSALQILVAETAAGRRDYLDTIKMGIF